jgi:hypothetical protein
MAYISRSGPAVESFKPAEKSNNESCAGKKAATEKRTATKIHKPASQARKKANAVRITKLRSKEKK